MGNPRKEAHRRGTTLTYTLGSMENGTKKALSHRTRALMARYHPALYSLSLTRTDGGLTVLSAPSSQATRPSSIPVSILPALCHFRQGLFLFIAWFLLPAIIIGIVLSVKDGEIVSVNLRVDG